MSKYYSINEFSKILGVSAQTLRNWDNNGKFHLHHASSNGYKYYSHEQLNQVINKVRKLVRELIEEGGEDDDKNNPSNVASKQQTKD